MVLMLSLAFGTATLLSAVQLATAIPHPSTGLARALQKRDQVTFEDCDGDQQDKAGRAWSDAASLASITIGGELDDKTAFEDTKAFTHYFAAADRDTTKKMYSGIQAGSSGDRGNAFQLKFIITCKETELCKDSLAVTDATPNRDDFTAKIRLCPKFFTDDRTKNFLSSKELIRNPKRRDNSWCQPGKPFLFFETAGHTFLHEMTHLNQLGLQAGLFSDKNGADDTHGTEDIYAIADGYNRGSPEKSARKLMANWIKFDNGNGNGNKPEIKQVENAESYAAAATEFYFQKYCGWDEVLE